MLPAKGNKRRAESSDDVTSDDGSGPETPPNKKIYQLAPSSAHSDVGFCNSPTRRRLSFKQPTKPPKIFQDSVHGTIMMDPLLVAIIDTPQFQRLRDIKQLGVAYWVFPGACHNRFEHCIGTSHLCGLMLSSLKSLHENVYHDPVEITDKDILCVKIAGLCHDIGHGPFSHVFDGSIIPQMRPNSKWSHEKGSCDLFDHMLDVNRGVADLFDANGIGCKEKQLIKDMIMGGPPQASNEIIQTTMYGGKTYKKQFLYEIVSNKATGIDCDKFDYLARDTHHVGLKNSFDFQRYFKNVRIMPVDGQLRVCARDKEESNLYEMFHIRWTLHRQVYQHKLLPMIHDQLTEALTAADKVLGISSSINDMEKYTYMTDSIFYDILRSQHPGLQKAKQCLRRIQTRNLYQFCGEVNPAIVEDSESNELSFSQQRLSEQDVFNALIENGKNLTQDDIFVSKSHFSFGKGDKNPIEEMKFFGKDGTFKKPQLNKLSSLYPKIFKEEYIRVYCKSSEKLKFLKEAFSRWCTENGFKTA